GFPSVVALRERMASDLRKRADEAADRDYDEKVVEALIEQAQIEFPPVMVEREIDAILQEQLGGRAGMENALRRAGRSEADLRTILRPSALQRVQRSLALTEV